MKILLLGYGNPGRKDDGLGPAFVEAIRREGLPVTVDSDYQLTVEDAIAVAEHDVVVFADATVEGDRRFHLRRIEASRSPAFTTHHVAPEVVLGIAEDHFSATVRGYLLAIRGYDVEAFEEGLTARAGANLRAAVAFFREAIESGVFEEAGCKTEST